MLLEGLLTPGRVGRQRRARVRPGAGPGAEGRAIEWLRSEVRRTGREAPLMSLAMSVVEREAFLAETRVGIVSVAEEGRGPLTVPVWYSYEPGGQVRFVTGASSRKAQLIRKAGRASLCVQTETPPYRYVSVEGTVAISGTPEVESDVKPMAYRYLGERGGQRYLAMMAEARTESILVVLTPERWRTVDYGKRQR